MGTICHHTMSLDGFIAGRDDAMDWAFAHGGATSLARDTMDRIGAVLAGRRWYDLVPVLLGGGVRLFGGGDEGAGTIELERVALARPSR